MTQDNSSQTTPTGQKAGGDLFNTAAGWVLFAAGLGLGLSILADKYFHGSSAERPEQLGYVIAVAEDAGGGASEMSFAEALTKVTAADGEKVWSKCQSCHSINAGGANGVGPNLHAIMGAAVAAKPGFGYSGALKGLGGQWDWERMNSWLKNPRGYVDGTKMAFAGLGKIEDRAAVALYLNANGSNLPLPAFTPAAETAAEETAGAEGAQAGEEVAAEAGADAAPAAE
ncbi:c-type cytochrome [Erythrobacter sp. T5W1-R]|uniref:c-type cytochrome n=1 Tax=Erythrobacter sp. T5W1-R TaxID=3101752 RepID=UPI002AFF8980|nr:c-type cytochrome [Erythrobacter sp. T5W1-R]MEA1618331.1 c-type cytochrome [Erythrobacter sp. T5W1-R]